MRRRSWAIELAMGVFLVTGCGPASNEEGIIGGAKVVPTKPGMENIKSYGDIQTYQTEQLRKRQAEKKKAKTPSKGARP